MSISKNDGCLFNPIGVECSYADGLRFVEGTGGDAIDRAKESEHYPCSECGWNPKVATLRKIQLRAQAVMGVKKPHCCPKFSREEQWG